MSEELGKLFFSEAKNTISSLREILIESIRGFKDEHLDKSYRLIHTLKGAAGFMGLNDLVYICHKWEDSLSLIKKTGKLSDFLPTLSSAIEEINDVLTTSSDQEIFTVRAADLMRVETEILDLVEKISKKKEVNIRDSLERIYKGILSLRVKPLSEVYKRIRFGFNDLLVKTQKKAILQTFGGNITVEVESLKRIENILVHLVRNAVDHGIESADQRIKKGKGEYGIVSINASQEGSYLKVSVSDDGMGIDFDELKKRAEELGVKYDNPLDLIFLSGFSTKRRITDISGRGYGMDVVLSEAKNLGGWVNVKTEKDIGTTVEVYILSNIWNSRYIFGKVLDYNIALNLDYVYRVVEIENLLRGEGGYFLKFEDHIIPLVGYCEGAKYGVVLVRENQALAFAFLEILGVGTGSFVPFDFTNLTDFSGMVISEGGEVFVLPNLLRLFVKDTSIEFKHGL